MKKIICALSVAVALSGEAVAEKKCPTGQEMSKYVYDAIHAQEAYILKNINDKLGTNFFMISTTDALKYELDKESQGCDYKQVVADRDAIFLLQQG